MPFYLYEVRNQGRGQPLRAVRIVSIIKRLYYSDNDKVTLNHSLPTVSEHLDIMYTQVHTYTHTHTHTHTLSQSAPWTAEVDYASHGKQLTEIRSSSLYVHEHVCVCVCVCVCV